MVNTFYKSSKVLSHDTMRKDTMNEDWLYCEPLIENEITLLSADNYPDILDSKQLFKLNNEFISFFKNSFSNFKIKPFLYKPDVWKEQNKNIIKLYKSKNIDFHYSIGLGNLKEDKLSFKVEPKVSYYKDKDEKFKTVFIIELTLMPYYYNNNITNSLELQIDLVVFKSKDYSKNKLIKEAGLEIKKSLEKDYSSEVFEKTLNMLELLKSNQQIQISTTINFNKSFEKFFDFSSIVPTLNSALEKDLYI